MLTGSFQFKGQNYEIRRGLAGDVQEVTALVRSAYSIWTESGIEVGSPVTQTDELTTSYLLPHGSVVTDAGGKIIATVSLEVASLSVSGACISVIRRGKPDVYGFEKVLPSDFFNGKFLYLYRLAVARAHARGGLGRQLISAVEHFAKLSGFQGIVLDTQKNAEWLYHWYSRLGFETIGESNPSDLSDPVTVMMVKRV